MAWESKAHNGVEALNLVRMGVRRSRKIKLRFCQPDLRPEDVRIVCTIGLFTFLTRSRNPSALRKIMGLLKKVEHQLWMYSDSTWVKDRDPMGWWHKWQVVLIALVFQICISMAVLGERTGRLAWSDLSDPSLRFSPTLPSCPPALILEFHVGSPWQSVGEQPLLEGDDTWYKNNTHEINFARA